ncbi:hypothetical protein HWN40_00335 [Methanolobus zinderi]|jgi:hypothetical protein|uniref:Uncharacterized protein n=1 Tax=Methanolobus zinderi TaxID=536044 RepID=A0A7D5J778_9EURY|nr:hypothetical protein [Methanolobus zinderi]KXS43011.1 MAG: hypothetical protein AWU59_1344 [Methanolobus sp. T82-4]QLC48830.1 hypothetical protein HWN40_00335 [Methanolobus zinderi]
MRINLEPVGIIKKAGKCSEVLIYSEFEQLIKNIATRLGNSDPAEQSLLIVHRNKDNKDIHQVQVTKTNIIDRVGNILKVGKIDANDDSVIDVRLNE